MCRNTKQQSIHLRRPRPSSLFNSYRLRIKPTQHTSSNRPTCTTHDRRVSIPLINPLILSQTRATLPSNIRQTGILKWILPTYPQLTRITHHKHPSHGRTCHIPRAGQSNIWSTRRWLPLLKSFLQSPCPTRAAASRNKGSKRRPSLSPLETKKTRSGSETRRRRLEWLPPSSSLPQTSYRLKVSQSPLKTPRKPNPIQPRS